MPPSDELVLTTSLKRQLTAPTCGTLARTHSNEPSAERPSTLVNHAPRVASTISSSAVVPAIFSLKNLSPRTMSLLAGGFRIQLSSTRRRVVARPAHAATITAQSVTRHGLLWPV